jgi:hypothetical protein
MWWLLLAPIILAIKAIKFVLSHRTTRWLLIYLPAVGLVWSVADPSLPAWQMWLLLAPGWIIVYIVFRSVVQPMVNPDVVKRIRKGIDDSSLLTGPRLWAVVGGSGMFLGSLFAGVNAAVDFGGSLVVAAGVYGVSAHLFGGYINDYITTIGTQPSGYVLPASVEDYDADDYQGTDWIDVRRDTSTLVCGATRSGKSEAAKLLVYQMLQDWQATEPLVAYDRKDDWQTFFEECDVDYEVLSADRDETTVYWDLFTEVETERDIERIGRALFEKPAAQSRDDDFFSVAARQVFVGLCKYLRREYPEETPATNADLVRYVQRQSREDAYEDLTEYDDLRPAAQAIDPDAEGQAAGVWASLSQEIQDIFVGSFRAPAEQGETITLREYVEEPDGQALVLSHPHGFGSAVERVYSYLLDDAVRRSMARDGGAVLVLDEFPQLPRLDRLEELVNVGAGEDVRTLVTIQSIAQMRDVYGDDGATSLLAGMPTQILMRSGDPATTEYYRGQIGRRYEQVESESTRFAGLNEASTGTSEREEERHPFDERELRSLQPGECVVTRPDGWLHAQLPMFANGGRERIGECLGLVKS